LAYANALCAQHNFEGAMDAATAATAGFKVAGQGISTMWAPPVMFVGLDSPQ